MNELVIMRDQHAVTTSLVVAGVFGKEHKHVMRDIKNLTVQNWTVKEMFVEGVYKNERNREYPMFYMNRDGFTLLAMGFTGKKAMEFKLKFIDAFNEMEDYIKSQQQPIGDLELALRAALDNTTKIKKIETDVNMLKDSMRIDSNQEHHLRALVNAQALKTLGGKEAFAYKKLSRKVYSEIWRDFKNHFHLPRYGDLPRKSFDEGLEFIRMWRPSTSLAMEIKAANRQGSFQLIKGEGESDHDYH